MLFCISHDIHMTLFIQSDDSLVEDPVVKTEEPSFMQKVAMVTEAFGGEKRRRVIAAAQRNRLDSDTLESTLTSAVELAQENTQREGVWCVCVCVSVCVVCVCVCVCESTCVCVCGVWCVV